MKVMRGSLRRRHRHALQLGERCDCLGERIPVRIAGGVFTTNLQTMFRLHAELDVGAVNGNDIPGSAFTVCPMAAPRLLASVARGSLPIEEHD